MSIAKDCFNCWHFSAGMFIEQKFSILFCEVGHFWGPLRCRFKKISRFVLVYTKLYNIILEGCNEHEVPSPSGIDTGSHTDIKGSESHL